MKAKLKVIFFVLVCSPALFAAEDQYKGLTHMFKKLSDAGIDQVVELPYNQSLLANIGQQVKVHNILEMQEGPLVRPKPQSLLDGFKSSFQYYDQREVVPALTYKVGKDSCAYMEAVKVSSILVCYRKASRNESMLAPISSRGPACTTTMAQLSHCYIFAHRVDDVVRALTRTRFQGR